MQGKSAFQSKRIIHRDQITLNISTDKNDQVKFAYHGLVRTHSIFIRPHPNEVVTLWHRAPEIPVGCVEDSTPGEK